jgi:hypothetical protein
MNFPNVGKYKQESIMEQVFSYIVIGCKFATPSQQFVVHGRVELAHGFPVTLLAPLNQIYHT